jgi:hypothetical protein
MAQWQTERPSGPQALSGGACDGVVGAVDDGSRGVGSAGVTAATADVSVGVLGRRSAPTFAVTCLAAEIWGSAPGGRGPSTDADEPMHC